jgi:hypothetical protein
MLWDILPVSTQDTLIQIQTTRSHSPSEPGNLAKSRSLRRTDGRLGQVYLHPIIKMAHLGYTLSISWNSSRPCEYESNEDMSSWY